MMFRRATWSLLRLMVRGSLLTAIVLRPAVARNNSDSQV